MPYVERNQEGDVVGCYANPQTGYAEEFLPDDDPVVVAYLNPIPDPEEAKRKRRKEIADKMAASGVFEVFSYQAFKSAVQEIREKYPAPTTGMTDDQVITAMTTPSSPFYDPEWAKMKAYYDEMAAL